MKNLDFTIKTLGERKFKSPLELSSLQDDYVANFTDDDARIIYDIRTNMQNISPCIAAHNLMEKAGPREMIYFDPAKVKAGIVTCGGLCPGLNVVIRSIVMRLWHRYGVRNIVGIPFGYRGFLKQFGYEKIDLSPANVADIHKDGGTMLGSSRGYGDCVSEIVDSIEEMGLNMLFTIGGDGTQTGALNISQEMQRRGLEISLIGIPKTIDNDISFVQRSFGFETAVEKAFEAVSAGHVEAHDAPNGIGLVKVMGRQSGFIAAQTSLASNDVNFVLIPEVPFDLEGENGFLAHLKKRIEDRKHAVVLVAEGAGQDLLQCSDNKDASGNAKLVDIGLFLQDKIKTFFKKENIDINLKYIDPSYIIRATAANANDSTYCTNLGANAAHAAMAGKTELLVSLMHNTDVHVPIELAVKNKNTINPDGTLWRHVMDSTGQPCLMKN
jgi:6-phosphofructokinase 1